MREKNKKCKNCSHWLWDEKAVAGLREGYCSMWSGEVYGNRWCTLWERFKK